MNLTRPTDRRWYRVRLSQVALAASGILCAFFVVFAVGVGFYSVNPASTTKVNNLEISGTTDATGNVLARGGLQLTSGTGPTVRTVASNPNGSVVGTVGDLRLRTDTQGLYQNVNGGTVWRTFFDSNSINVAHDGTMTGTGSGGSPLSSLAQTSITMCGNGSDGNPTFDGAATILGVAPGGTATIKGVSVTFYVQNRDWYFDSPTINSGIAIYTNGFRVYASGTITNNGFIGYWGVDGSNGAAGALGIGGTARPANILGGSSAGGDGGNTSTGQGTAGNNIISTPRDYANTGGAGGTGAGGAGGDGGRGRGGGGGANKDAAAGSASGTITTATAIQGDIENYIQCTEGLLFATTTRFNGGSGGGGGRGQQVAPTGGGGGGGSGGAAVGVCGKRFAGTGKITAVGGNGGIGFTSAGGGGGGGGGWICLQIGDGALPTTDVTGGVGGTSAAGTGGHGGAGGDGVVKTIRLGVP